MTSTLLRLIIGGSAGVLIGLAMYKFIGCRTGACPLTGNPYVAATLWGILGLIFASGR
jgi:hypothetical protein